MTTKITPHTAKKLLKSELDRLTLPYTKLTARTVSFTDLARENAVFVKIHGWQPNKLWNDLTNFAVKNGFRIEA